jgi:hypothetical protein
MIQKLHKYASLINIAIVGTNLRDKAADKDSLIAFVVPSAFVAVADSFSESLHKHAGELGFSDGLASILNLANSQSKIEESAKTWIENIHTNNWEVSFARFLILSRCTEESTSVAFSHTCNIAESPENHKVCLNIFLYVH